MPIYYVDRTTKKPSSFLRWLNDKDVERKVLDKKNICSMIKSNNADFMNLLSN
jgi:hypothetical protein